MILIITVWIRLKRLLDQLALHQAKKRSPLKYLILATLSCVLTTNRSSTRTAPFRLEHGQTSRRAKSKYQACPCSATLSE
ncbi:hypothetical protein MVEG_04296 [Podila verticillata NRRL 6337]|nr:hypothetical protein MVEG_04296 [Podila verticillata NRRL 6337]